MSEQTFGKKCADKLYFDGWIRESFGRLRPGIAKLIDDLLAQEQPERRWVCENHPGKHWPDECDCGPGMLWPKVDPPAQEQAQPAEDVARTICHCIEVSKEKPEIQLFVSGAGTSLIVTHSNTERIKRLAEFQVDCITEKARSDEEQTPSLEFYEQEH